MHRVPNPLKEATYEHEIKSQSHRHFLGSVCLFCGRCQRSEYSARFRIFVTSELNVVLKDRLTTNDLR